jgi:hypothetical protein
VKTYVICLDCGGSTAAPMQVYRMLGPEGSQYRGLALVHRNRQGCHVALSASEVRGGSPHRHHTQLAKIVTRPDGSMVRFCSFDGETF